MQLNRQIGPWIDGHSSTSPAKAAHFQPLPEGERRDSNSRRQDDNPDPLYELHHKYGPNRRRDAALTSGGLLLHGSLVPVRRDPRARP